MASHEMVVRSGRQLDRAALSRLDFHPDRSPVKVSCYVQANHLRSCLNGEHEKACPAMTRCKTEDVPTTWGMGGATNRMCQKVLTFFLSATPHCATERLLFHFSLSWIGGGNGNPLQCSCPENPRDGEAWWAAVYGVAQSRTRLKWLSSSSSGRILWAPSLRSIKLFWILF